LHRATGADVDPSRTIVWALGLSLALHLLLLLLSLRFPIRSTVVAVADREETRPIAFYFTREAEPTTTDPREDAPFVPVEPAETPVMLPPVEPQAPQPWPVEPQRPTPAPPEGEPAAEPEASAAPAPAVASAVDGRGSLPPPGPPAGRRIDLGQALRDYGRTRAESPPLEGRASAAIEEASVYTPDLSSVPYVGYGLGNLVFESGDFDWEDYGRQIYTAIWRAWHLRLWATTDDFEKWASLSDQWMLGHMAAVSFVIERNGHVTGIVTRQGSGCDPFDASVQQALEEVILPPLPASFPRDRETVSATFTGRGPVRGMRPTLNQLRRAGLF
jgi:outer membrane biosynthesis protein TonB